MDIPVPASNRRLFITQEGLFGTSPSFTEVGDSVHVLLVSRLPFVSRPLASALDNNTVHGEKLSL
jgi:hypothetical protein